MKPRIDPEDQPGGSLRPIVARKPQAAMRTTARTEPKGFTAKIGALSPLVAATCSTTTRRTRRTRQRNAPGRNDCRGTAPHDWHQQGHINGRPFSVCQSCGAERYDDQ